MQSGTKSTAEVLSVLQPPPPDSWKFWPSEEEGVAGIFSVDGFVVGYKHQAHWEGFPHHLVFCADMPPFTYRGRLEETTEGGIWANVPLDWQFHVRMFHISDQTDSSILNALQQAIKSKRKVTMRGKAGAYVAFDENMERVPELDGTLFGQSGFDDTRKCPFVTLDNVVFESWWKAATRSMWPQIRMTGLWVLIVAGMLLAITGLNFLGALLRHPS